MWLHLKAVSKIDFCPKASRVAASRIDKAPLQSFNNHKQLNTVVYQRYTTLDVLKMQMRPT